jgi:hypothetical protein
MVLTRRLESFCGAVVSCADLSYLAAGAVDTSPLFRSGRFWLGHDLALEGSDAEHGATFWELVRKGRRQAEASVGELSRFGLKRLLTAHAHGLSGILTDIGRYRRTPGSNCGSSETFRIMARLMHW